MKEHPYQHIIDLLLDEGYASTSLLVDHFHYSQEKAFYILEDLQFHDLVSSEDHLGMRDLYFLSQEEAMNILKNRLYSTKRTIIVLFLIFSMLIRHVVLMVLLNNERYFGVEIECCYE